MKKNKNKKKKRSKKKKSRQIPPTRPDRPHTLAHLKGQSLTTFIRPPIHPGIFCFPGSTIDRREKYRDKEREREREREYSYTPK
jgi:hypothetical protein